MAKYPKFLASVNSEAMTDVVICDSEMGVF